MNKNIMVLKDSTEIQMEDGSDKYSIHIVVEDLATLGTLWDKLTMYNLAEVSIKNTECAEIGTYKDMALCSPAFRSVDKTEDGRIQAAFEIRQKTELELLKEQILALERNQEQFGQRAEAIRRDRETYRKEQASYREQQEELREQLETVSKDREEKEQQRAQLQWNIQEKEAIVEKSKGEIITLLIQNVRYALLC